MTTLLDGKKIAADIRGRVAEEVEALRAGGIVPTVAIVVATDDGSTTWYVRSISKAAEKIGIVARVETLGADAPEAAIATRLGDLAADPAVHGIILQTPLPEGVRAYRLAELIPAAKDIDGINPISAGRLMAGRPAFAPATASAVLEILESHGVPLSGARVAMVGRSMVVGKPAAHLLLARNATVTICHSRTRDLAAVTSEADVVVAAIGRPRFLGAHHVRIGATVVDVGTTPDEDGNLVGDVDAEAVSGRAGQLTPVPGGVGPITTAHLLRNTAQAAAEQR